MGRDKPSFIKQPAGRRRRSIRLRTGLMVLMTLILVLCASSTTLFSYFSYKDILIQQIASSRSDVLLQISAKLESLQRNMVTVSNLYSYVVTGFAPETLGEARTQALKRFSAAYENALQTIDPDCYVTVLGEDGFRYASGGRERAVSQEELWFLRIPIHMEEGEVFWTQSHKEEGGGYSFSLARRLTGGDGLGYTLLVSIPERTIYQTYENIISNNALYVVRMDGRIVSQNSEKMVDLNYFNMTRLNELVSSGGYRIVEKSGVKFLLSRCDNEQYGLLFIEEIPLDDLLEPLRSVQLLTVLVVVSMVALACGAVLLVVHAVTSPLRQLCQRLMRVSTGDFQTRFDISSWSEINLINDVSQEMTSKISSLFDNLKDTEREKRLAELDFLQAQINPHFMYNTLFSIKCLVSLGENQAAERMLDSFTGMLRTVLESKEEIISLQQELDTLQQYFTVLQCRYGDGIRMELEIPQELLQHRVLKFVLQPLVENSIFHGLEPVGSRGVITVRAGLEPEGLVLEVVDNGAGMTPEQLAQVRRQLSGEEHANVGIRNVLKRVRLHFGDAYGLEVTSEKAVGTCVRLTLPVLPPDRKAPQGGGGMP